MEPEMKVFDYRSHLKMQRDLFKECFPENLGTPVVTEDHYKWKFHGSGRKPPSYEYSAFIDGEMAGYYAAINYPYLYCGKEINNGMVCDVMTGVKARGKGLFSALGRYAIEKLRNENIEFLTGFPIRKEVIPGHRKAEWEFPFIIPMYGRFLKFNSFLSSRGIGWARYILNPLLYISDFLLRLPVRYSHEASVSVYSAEEIESIPGFEFLLNKLQNQTTVSLKKDLEFLKWRLGAPGKKYTLALLSVNSEPVGYMAGRFVIKEKVPCFGVIDFSLVSGYEKYSTILIRETEKIANDSGAELILIMMLKKYASLYRFFRNGWLRTPFNFNFIIKKTGSLTELRVLEDENNWFLTWLNSDDL